MALSPLECQSWVSSHRSVLLSGKPSLREVDYTRLWSHGLRALAGGGAGSVVQNLCSQAGAFPLYMAQFPDGRVLS